MPIPPGPDSGLVSWTPDPSSSPPPDPALEPEGFVLAADDGTKLHFLDWGGPPAADQRDPGILLVPGLLQPAWSWAPVARRLGARRRTVVTDLRGQGLSDAPMDGYDLETLAADAVAVAEGSGVIGEEPGAAVVLAGHGFGGLVAAGAAAQLGTRCAGVVLVDGGWERLEETTDVDVDEFLRGLDEPPEVLRSMAAWLADRRAFDPATFDADQERLAREAVVETAAGHLVSAVRPHVVELLVRAMFDADPAPILAAVDAPLTVLVALAAADPGPRLAELHRAAGARAAAGRLPIRVVTFERDAHNLMRYRPAEVAAAILETTGRD